MPPQSPKAITLQAIVKKQFTDNKDELDQQKVHKMKQACVLVSNSSRFAPAPCSQVYPCVFPQRGAVLVQLLPVREDANGPKAA